jgi:hypothetical protein
MQHIFLMDVNSQKLNEASIVFAVLQNDLFKKRIFWRHISTLANNRTTQFSNNHVLIEFCLKFTYF